MIESELKDLLKEQEFIDKVAKVATIYRFNKKKGLWYDEYDKHEKLTKGQTINDFLFVEWHTGGISGGSCWESSNPQPYSTDEPEPEFTDLDNVLLSICPSIPYLQYKSFNNLIKEDYRTELEYYGNCEEYKNKKISLRVIYDKLKEFNLI